MRARARVVEGFLTILLKNYPPRSLESMTLNLLIVKVQETYGKRFTLESPNWAENLLTIGLPYASIEMLKDC